jgi:hypothetical protein
VRIPAVCRSDGLPARDSGSEKAAGRGARQSGGRCG